MKKEKFDITGMSCSACSSRVEKAVRKVDGTANVTVNLLTNSMQLEYDEAKRPSNMRVTAHPSRERQRQPAPPNLPNREKRPLKRVSAR